jgi:uncharacterized protein
MVRENQYWKMAMDYVEAIINKDVSQVDRVEKIPERVRLLLRSFSGNISTAATNTTVQKDLEANGFTISDKTISAYLNALRRIFVIEDLPAWLPSVQSKTAIRTSEKRHFVDPSIATAVMRLDLKGF